MNTLQSEWEHFKKSVVPATASAIQVQEMRRAFYAGAASMWRLNLICAKAGRSEAAGAAMLDVVYKELNDFSVHVQMGRR